MRCVKLRRTPEVVSLESRLTPAIINFTLTTGSSSLTLGGTLNGIAIQTQGAGSLTSIYSGTGQVDVDFAGNTITTLAAGSIASANINGIWQPLPGGATGSASADYGGKVTIPVLPPFVFVTAYIAARNLTSNLSSGPLVLSGVGATKSFPSTQTFSLLSGDADYNAGSLGTGTTPLTGKTATNQSTDTGSFTDNGDGTYKLATPIDVTINDTVNGQPAVYTIKGTLNSTAVLPVVDLNGAAAGFDVAFSSGGTPTVFIAPAATITRNPSANLTGMTVTLASPPDGASESLAVDLTGTGLSTTGYIPGTGTLKITGSGSLATYQSVLRKVAYSDTKILPTQGSRTVTVSVDDGANVSLDRTAAGTLFIPLAKISDVQVNDGSPQRSRVESLVISFDQHVSLPPNTGDAFQLIRHSDGMPVNLAAVPDDSGPVTKVTLTFSGGAVNGTSLADGRYDLTVVANVVNLGNLDGNNDSTAQGSPLDDYKIEGDPATNKLFRFFGDFNGDGAVATSDFIQFRLVFNGTSAIFDFDGDGSVSASDFIQFRLRFNGSI